MSIKNKCCFNMLRLDVFRKILFVSLLLSLSTGNSQELIPVEVFASTADVRDVKLSPNGRMISSLVNVNLENKKGTVLSITDLASGQKEYPMFADNKTLILETSYWVSDEVLLIETSFPESRYGVATTETRLIAYNLKTKKSKNVFSKNYLKRLVYVPNRLSDIIDILPDDKQHFLISLSGFNRTGESTVVKVSLDSSGKTKVIKEIETDVSDWMTDAQHRVRIGIALEGTIYKIYEHDVSDKDERRLLWEFEAFSKEEVWPMGFALDPQILYVKTLHNGFDAVFKVNLKDPILTKQLVYFNDDYDVGGSLRRSFATGEVVGVGSYYWDDGFKKLQETLDASMPDTDNTILNYSSDDNHYVAYSTSDMESGIFLLGDKDKKTLRALAYSYSKITPELLSEKKIISYNARDGLKIEGYLTLPKGKNKKNLPTVIFPHGGPISYDGSGFDYWTQFLASRGYAVLQMNFRGSYGYGFDFMNMGVGNWGQGMQDDVEDGTKWLVEEGIADPKHICILGGSYGGYAALMGAIKTPDLYQCAVSFAGVTDLNQQRLSKAYIGYEASNIQLGDEYKGRWERSPLKHAKKIDIPILLIHGTKDRVVKVSQSEDMYQALKRAKKDVKYIELKKGNHYLSNGEHRLTTFRAIESFLADNLLAK